MSTINTSSVRIAPLTYTPAQSASEKNTQVSSKTDSKDTGVNLLGKTLQKPGAAPAAPTESSDSGSAREQAIKQLQEQIKETQKTLERQQAMLSAAQNSRAPDEEKAAQVMSIQQQIAGTMAQLNAQQGALLELMKGTVKTTA